MSFTEDCEMYLLENNIRMPSELEKMSNKEIRDLYCQIQFGEDCKW